MVLVGVIFLVVSVVGEWDVWGLVCIEKMVKICKIIV